MAGLCSLQKPALSHNVNRDGAVNILDLVEAASQFGQSGTPLTGDANGNGKVDVSDLELIGSHLGENAAAPSLHFSRPAPTVNYQASDVKRQFQALTAFRIAGKSLAWDAHRPRPT